MSFRSAVAAVSLCASIAAAKSHAQATTAGLPGRVVRVEAGEFFLRAVDTIPAGLTTFELRQVGMVERRVRAGGASLDSLTFDRGDQTRGFHMLWIVRLDDGRTATDFARALQAGAATPWARSLGGPGFALPPGTTNATLALEPGAYVLVCHVGSAREDLTRHHARNGMFRALTVVPSRAPGASLPAADVVVRVAEDGTLHFSGPVVAGRRVVRVENASARDYEFLVRRVLPGHTAAEALAWRRSGRLARAPFLPVGGLSDVPPRGGTLTTTITLVAGDHFVGGTTRTPFTVVPPRR